MNGHLNLILINCTNRCLHLFEGLSFLVIFVFEEYVKQFFLFKTNYKCPALKAMLVGEIYKCDLGYYLG